MSDWDDEDYIDDVFDEWDDEIESVDPDEIYFDDYEWDDEE